MRSLSILILLAAVFVSGCMVSRVRAMRDDPEAAKSAKVVPGACSTHYDRAAGIIADMDMSVKSADRDRGEIIAEGGWGQLAVWFDAQGGECRVKTHNGIALGNSDYAAEFWKRFK